MRITNNYTNNILNLPVQNDKPQKEVNFKGKAPKDTKKIPSAENLQANFGVKKPSDIKYTVVRSQTDNSEIIQSVVKLNAGDILVLKIDEDTTDEFLRNENGEINDALTLKFISIYKQLAENLASKNDSDLEFYGSQMQETSNIETFNPRDNLLSELSKQQSDDEFARNVVEGLHGKKKKELARLMYDFSCVERTKTSNKAFNLTKGVFELSKTQNGCDLSDIDRKIAVLNRAQYVENEYGEPEILSLLCEYAKKDDGSYDIECLEDMLSLMSSFGLVISPKTVADTVKKYCSADKESHDEILTTMIKLQSSDYALSEDSSDFYDVMNLCFDDDKKFSPLRAQSLLKLVDLAGEFIDENMENFDDYSIYTEKGKSAIVEYFKCSTDANGEFRPELDAAEFIKNKMSALL